MATGMAGELGRLQRALGKVARTLDNLGVPYMVIGGFAATVWGEPRLTADLDITIQCEGSEETLVQRLSAVFAPRVRDPVRFVRQRRVLPATTDEGVELDIIFAGVSYEADAIRRAAPVEVEGYEVRICTPEDLIIHKVISPRPRDQEDVRSVVRQRREQLDRSYMDPIVAEVATALDQPDILLFYESLWRA